MSTDIAPKTSPPPLCDEAVSDNGTGNDLLAGHEHAHRRRRPPSHPCGIEGCRMPAVRGGAYCVNHDPGHRERMRAARERGGRNHRRELRCLRGQDVPATLLRPSELMAFGNLVIRKVATGGLDVRIAAAVGQLIEMQARLWERFEAEQLADKAEHQLGLATGRNGASAP